MRQVQISDLKSHLSEHLRRAESGESIEVLDRACPIARVVPIGRDEAAMEVIPAEQPFVAVRSIRPKPVKLAMSSLEALRLERGSQ